MVASKLSVLCHSHQPLFPADAADLPDSAVNGAPLSDSKGEYSGPTDVAALQISPAMVTEDTRWAQHALWQPVHFQGMVTGTDYNWAMGGHLHTIPTAQLTSKQHH